MVYVFAVALLAALTMVGLGRYASRHPLKAPKPITGRRTSVKMAGSRCPCGGFMELRLGQHGQFLGCSNYQSDRGGCNFVRTINGRRFN